MAPCYVTWQLLRNTVLSVFGKHPLLKDPDDILHLADKHAMGHFDRLVSVKDLPADKILIAYLKEAALLNKNGIKLEETENQLLKKNCRCPNP